MRLKRLLRDLIVHCFLHRLMVELFGTQLVESDEEGWLVYDITNVLNDWIRQPDSNLGIKVAVETEQGNNAQMQRCFQQNNKGLE